MKVFNAVTGVWLEVISLTFGPQGNIVRIPAKEPGSNALADGWLDIRGEDLKKVFVGEFICLNPELFSDPNTAKVL